MPACCQISESVSQKPLEEASYRSMWIRLGIALVIAGQAMMFGLGMNMSAPEAFSTTYWVLHGLLIASTLAVMGLLGVGLVRETWAACCRREVSVEGLFLLTALGAFFASLISTLRGVGAIYYEVVAITLIIYVIGKTLGLQTRSKALAEVKRLREDFSHVKVRLADGALIQKAVCDLLVGECVWVMPGEAIAVDGEVIDGQSLVRETALTGEPDAVRRSLGDRVLAGTYTVDGSLLIAPKLGDRVLDGILRTVEHARLEPSRWQIQANKLMQWFFPFVVLVTIATFLYWWAVGPWDVAIFNSMAVLVVACPCALGLATPLAVWGGLAHLATRGLVASSGRFLDTLADVKRIVFDKTGTLTLGTLRLKKLYTAHLWSVKEQELQGLIYAVQA
ncbi:MAG TPA: HAD-IC family P-type ATPase, partial [Opitutales bacterium]|nr:HAD-IC family P-type ATPase [Opitutales bacterium]